MLTSVLTLEIQLSEADPINRYISARMLCLPKPGLGLPTSYLNTPKHVLDTANLYFLFISGTFVCSKLFSSNDWSFSDDNRIKYGIIYYNINFEYKFFPQMQYME